MMASPLPRIAPALRLLQAWWGNMGTASIEGAAPELEYRSFPP